MRLTNSDACALARATYWLSTLYRRGESLPDGIGVDVAADAAIVARKLRLQPDTKLVAWPEGRWRLRIRFEDAANAATFAAMHGGTMLDDSSCEVTNG